MLARMTPRRRDLPLPLQNASFAPHDLRARGRSAERARRADIDHPFHGVSSHGIDLSDRVERAQALTQRRDMPPFAFSHLTGAMLLGLPLPSFVERGALQRNALQITVAHPARAPRLAGVDAHAFRHPPRAVRHVRLVAAGSGELHMLPLLCDDWLAVSLATQLGLDDLVAIFDALRYRASADHDSSARWASAGNEATAAAATAGEAAGEAAIAAGRMLTADPRSADDGVGQVSAASRLANPFDRLDFTEAFTPGRRGASRARQAFALSRAGVRSRPETLLRLLITRAGLPEPVVGHTIAEAGWAATPDLAWPAYSVLLEYEGDHHRTSARQFRHDIRRFERYADCGWSALRVTKHDLFSETSEVIARAESRLRRSGWAPPRAWRPRPVPPFRP